MRANSRRHVAVKISQLYIYKIKVCCKQLRNCIKFLFESDMILTQAKLFKKKKKKKKKGIKKKKKIKRLKKKIKIIKK